MIRLRLWLLCVVAGCFLFGCGGSGGGSSSGGGNTPLSLKIDWPTRSRNIKAPASALSVVVTLDQAAPDGTNFVFPIDRGTDITQHTASYRSVSKAKVGNWILHVDMYSDVGGGGILVAQADASVRLKSDGQLYRSDGTPLGYITTSPNFTSVLVSSNPTAVGETTPLNVSVVAAGIFGVIVPGGYTAQVVQGSDKVQVNPQASITGLAEGDAEVVVTVDGRQSQPGSVHIDPRVLAARSVAVSTSALAAHTGDSQIYFATPSAAPSSSNSVGAIDAASGAIAWESAAGSDPNHLALSSDGSTLLVGLQGSTSVETFDIAGRTAGTPIFLGADRLPRQVGALAFVPGSNTNFAVALEHSGASPDQDGVRLYLNGVAAPDEAPFWCGGDLAFNAAGDQLYTSTQWGQGALTRLAVNSQGLTVSDGFPAQILPLGTELKFASGWLYSSNGAVVAPTIPRVLGTFETPSFSQLNPSLDQGSVAVDTANDRVWLISRVSQDIQIRAYKISTFQQVDAGMLRNPFSVFDPPGSVPAGALRWGAKGLAFRTPSHVFLIDSAPGL